MFFTEILDDKSQDTTTIPQDTTINPSTATTYHQDTITIPPNTTANPQETTTMPQDTTTIAPNTTANPPDTTTSSQVATTIPQDTTVMPQDTTTNSPDIITTPKNFPLPIDCALLQVFCKQDPKLEKVPTIDSTTTTVEISKTSIQKLDSSSFTGLTQLKVLILNQNKIALIEPGTFSGQRSMTHLDLSYNVLQTLNGAMLEGLVSLKVLRITGNNITSMDPQTFSNLIHLLKLQVDINQLSTSRDIFLSSSSYSVTSKPPDVDVENSPTLLCDKSTCWLKEAGEKVNFMTNGTYSRPRCSKYPDTYWDEFPFNCNSYGTF